MSKTIIPFKPTQTISGDGLPGAAEVVVLFNSVTAFGPKTLQLAACHYWFTYAVLADANATGNTITADYSDDGGATWFQYYVSATNEPVGDNSTFIDEIFIGPIQDFRVRFTNGAAAQTAFRVNMSLDASERGSSA